MFFSTNNILIKLSSNKKDIEKYFSQSFFPAVHLPEYCLVNKKKGGDFYVNVRIGKNNFLWVDISKKKLYYEVKKCDWDPNNLVFLILSILERLSEEKRDSTYLVHSAAVSKNDKNVVIFGRDCCGKTIIMKYLCELFNFKFISNERTIMNFKDRTIIYGGTKNVSALKTHFNDYILLSQELSLEKIIFQAKDFYNVEKNPSKNKVVLFVYPILDNSINKVEELSEWKATTVLYEEITKVIRGSSYLSHNYLLPFPNLDGKKLSIKRIQFVKNLIKSHKFLSIRGTPKFISEKINFFIKTH